MRGVLHAGIVIVLLSFALSACGSEKAQASPDDWAAGVCSAEQKFAEAIANSRDNADPSSLELAARKERAARVGNIEIEAAKQLEKDLDAIEPPKDAKQFHEAIINNARELAKTIETQLDAIDKATTAQQIAVANASAEFDRQGSNTEVTAKAATLTDELIQALTTQPQCGEVPVPGETPAPAPTPGV